MKSIIQQEKECYISGSKFDLHEHHVFGGSNRKNSEKYGLKIWLRSDLHIGDKGIHFDKEFALEVKRTAQKKAMEHYGWKVEDFIKIFGRNYI